jgi:hypothetical protein
MSELPTDLDTLLEAVEVMMGPDMARALEEKAALLYWDGYHFGRGGRMTAI